MPNISDVARRAGVSSATVSRALQNDPRVTDATKKRVREAASELGYRPNRIARSLRTQRSETVGVIVSDIENPHFTRAVRVIENMAFDAGLRLVLCNTDETPEKQRSYLEVLSAEWTRGILLVPNDPSDPLIGELVEQGTPIVAFDREVDHPQVDAVIPDNRGAMTMAVDHLVQRGCQHIAAIGGRATIQTGRERLDGFRTAMHEVGMEPLSVEGGFRERGAFEATTRLLHEHPEVDGVIASNNLMTVGALKAIKAAGRTVPGDVRLLGFDDPTWGTLLDPSITSIAQPIREMATTAFAMLLERIDGLTDPGRRIVYPCVLNERDSTGA